MPPIIATSILVSLDQVTKFLAQAYLTQGQTYVSNIGGIIGITYKINPGLMLNLGNVQDTSLIILLHLAALTVVIWAYWYFAKQLRHTLAFQLSFSFGFAFVLGNLIDRLCFGYVRDFITWFGPGTFNLADLYWDLGVVIFAIEYVRQQR